MTKGERGDIMYKLSAGKPEASKKKSKSFLKKLLVTTRILGGFTAMMIV